MLRYVVTYADGQTADVPVYAEIDIDDYRQKEPRAIPGRNWPGCGRSRAREQSAVAYAKQWNNPRPDVEIKSIDMVYGEQTAGRARADRRDGGVGEVASAATGNGLFGTLCYTEPYPGDLAGVPALWP